ncbi:pyridoxamine 5'-phosphate oxidase-domain-containing protein [Podospora australis]|uniref:Pyridoxamine 5'-phosphate oxidase-domain-containing protein n=1 Tax=Podospora australis TaxID=1536484 RepID=A0AAN6X563_9PEZI|nr:pyridoxamine 5'-phosphate oxidase-domain-containing protein [Podospora australis]
MAPRPLSPLQLLTKLTSPHFRSLPTSPPFKPSIPIPSHKMSSQNAPAPWRQPFLEHISQLSPPTFTLATLHPVPAASAPSLAIPCVPRARTCVFRGLWASLPQNEKNTAPKNPPSFESDLPVFTTDARMDKTSEIFDTAGGTDQTSSGTTSGGGGPVEAVFWVEATKTQWRIRGHAWVLGPDIDDELSDGARKVQEVLSTKMRKTGEGEFYFGKEVTAHFGNLSPMMRGSFKAPAPGKPMAYSAGEGEGKLGETVEDVEDQVARKNFRVVVIVPEEVDQVDLSEEVRPRRWLYEYREKGESRLAGGEVVDGWEKVELWP